MCGGQSVNDFNGLLVQVFEFVGTIPNAQLFVVSVLPRPGRNNDHKKRYTPHWNDDLDLVQNTGKISIVLC